MNKSQEKKFDLYEIIPQKEILKIKKENSEEENIIDYINKNIDYGELKKIIEQKIDYYLMKEYNELLNSLEEKMEDLLMKQEKIFIKKEMLKQKIFYLEKYLKSYYKKNNIEYKDFN